MWNFHVKIQQKDGGKLTLGSQSLHSYCFLFKLMLLALEETRCVLSEITVRQPHLQLSVTKKQHWWTGPQILGLCAAQSCSKELTICRSKTHTTAAEPLACIQENDLFLLTSHQAATPSSLKQENAGLAETAERGKVQTSSYQQRVKSSRLCGSLLQHSRSLCKSSNL